MLRKSMLRFERTALIAAIVLATGITINGIAPRAGLGAAPEKPANTNPPAINAQGKRVTDMLIRVLRERVSDPDGSMKLVVIPTTNADKGYFSEVYIAARPAKIKKKLRVSELVMRSRNVHIDVAHLFLERKIRTIFATTSLRAVVSEDDLTELLAKGRHTEGMGLRVKYLGQKIRVTGHWNWTWFNGPIDGLGTLRLIPGHKVNLDILSLKLNGREVPQFIKDKFSEKINPVIDYEDVPFQPPFRGVKVKGNKATVYT